MAGVQGAWWRVVQERLLRAEYATDVSVGGPLFEWSVVLVLLAMTPLRRNVLDHPGSYRLMDSGRGLFLGRPRLPIYMFASPLTYVLK